MAKTIWDYLTDAGETMATLGTGAVAPFAGGAYGIYKGVTSPDYGTIQGGREADRAAIEMTNRLTYQPRGEATRGLLGAVGGAVGGAADFLKLPPLLPEAAILGALGLNNNAIMSQTQRGMQAAKPMVGNAMESYMARTGLAPRMMPESPVMPTTPTAPVSPAGFYSAAEQAALNLPRNKGTGQALLNDLMKGADVKKDELQATGVLDAFANRPQATKQELVDFLQANRVEVGQTQLGTLSELDPAGMAKREEVFDKYYPEIQSIYKEIDATNYDTDFKTSQNLDNKLRTLTNARDMEANAAYAIPSSKPAKFDRFQLPGGENYREVLLTLPNKNKKTSEIAKKYGYGPNDPLPPEVQSEILAQQDKNYADKYQSSHWDEPNVMAHLRLNDRVDVDGKKMTMIEEVQSDWHQAGREVGYKGKARKITPQEREEWRILDGMDANKRTPEMYARLNTLDQVMAGEPVGGVPDAPMKDTWYQTALRKAVKDAIDSGSDRVGITTGARQVDRYTDELRSNVDAIEYEAFKSDAGETLYEVAGIKNGKSVVNLEELTFDALKKNVGKDMAEKIRNNAGESLSKERPMRPDWMRISGDDLTIGGEGMKKYYDEMYPKYLDKFAKKYGSKVSDGSIDVGDRAPSYGLPSIAEFEANRLPNEFMPEYIKRMKSERKMEPVRYIDITPAMRKALGGKDKGVPLFQAAPLIPAGVAGSSGLLDQFGGEQQ